MPMPFTAPVIPVIGKTNVFNLKSKSLDYKKWLEVVRQRESQNQSAKACYVFWK